MSAPRTATPGTDSRSDSAALPDTSALDLTPLHEVNQRCIHALVETARNTEREAPFGFVALLRDQLKALDDAAQRRAAGCPFLLVSIGFHDEAWWRSVKQRSPRTLRDPAWLGCFPRVRAVPLARSTLTLAWHMARSNPAAARLLLGMSRGCAEVIASSSLAELETIAHRQYRCIRPRWEERPAIWKTLLSAAQRSDGEALRDFRVYGVQRIVGEILHLSTAR